MRNSERAIADPLFFGSGNSAFSELGGRWPLSEQSRRFDLGLILNSAVTDAIEPNEVGLLGMQHAGLWECDLADNSLIWSGGVYDLFGLPRGCSLTRDEALGHYSERSRAKLERVRSYAIRNRCGFTLDVEIRPTAISQIRRVRIIAAPVYEDDVAVRLHGIKIAV